MLGELAVVRALALDPDLLVLDEAMNALDTVTTHRLCTLFERLGRRDDRSILVVTHDHNIAHRLADRTVDVEVGEWDDLPIGEGKIVQGSFSATDEDGDYLERV